MNTTQTNPETAVPQSAQQRNGAARSAQEQRSAAGIPRSAPQPEKKRTAPKQERKQSAARQQEAAPGQEKRKASARQQEAPQRKRSPQEQKNTGTSRKASSKAAPSPEASAKAAGTRKNPAAAKQSPDAEKSRKTAQKQQTTKGKLFGKNKKQQEPAYTKGLPDSVSNKKRAYGNSKPKKKTVLDHVNDAVKRSGEKKAEKIIQRQADREKGVRKKPSQQQITPAVIYTEPQAFNRSRFLIQMLTVLTVVVALVMGLSVFFKVKTIRISGAEIYSNWAVREASGIAEGDNLLTFSHARAGAQIKANLPYVKSVRFGIKLPDTVNIMIEEEAVVYAIKDQKGAWWLMNSDGRMVEQSNDTAAAQYTQVLGITVTDPVSNERGVATESAVVYETDEAGATVPVPVSVTGAQRLSTALQILQALEANDIVGDAASVDVTRLEDIILWYGTRFQVNLGDSTNVAYKIDCMNDCILQMGEYQTGVLDISFTIWPNQVGFTPFS